MGCKLWSVFFFFISLILFTLALLPLYDAVWLSLMEEILGRFNERVWHITVAKCVAVFGFVLACSTFNIGARYFAMCTFATGVYACNSVILGWVSTTCGQTREKKAISLAMVNTIATVSSIYTPVSCQLCVSEISQHRTQADCSQVSLAIVR